MAGFPAIVTAVRELNTRPQVPAGGWGCLRWSLVPSPTTTPSERATCQTRPMTTRHCLVTGANRGAGLEFIRQLLARGDRVAATCRQPGRATALNAMAGDHTGRLHRLPLDVAAPPSHAAPAQALLRAKMNNTRARTQ